jgi:hypothetical protein
MFFQLHTVHGTVKYYAFPLLCSLCVRKDEETYTYSFQQLKNSVQGMNLEPNQRCSTMHFDSYRNKLYSEVLKKEDDITLNSLETNCYY